jgi:hypothetical protein
MAPEKCFAVHDWRVIDGGNIADSTDAVKQ